MLGRHRSKSVIACIVGIGVATLGIADAVRAEVPDVGETVATASAAYGQTTITGTMATADDIDMYAICISDPAAFSVTVGGLGAGSNDGQLFLFDASGLGKAAVDDTGGGTLVPGIPAGTAVVAALAPGEYLIAVSNFDRDPVAGGSEIFPSAVGVVGPTIANQPVDGWNGAGNANAMTTYTLTLTGAGCAAPVLTTAADITASATSGSGATVNYVVPTATNFLGQALGVVCAPPSGGTFPIGVTTVTCSTTDSLGQTTSGTFQVTVTNDAPVITVPADIVVTATGASGAMVSYVATASDLEQGALTPVCAPASGSTFPIGTTVVTCTVTDFGGLAASDTFNVDVQNNPPVVTVPANITINATGASGAVVTFTASATDLEDGSLVPVCTPPSGSPFAIGTTSVSCTATDSSAGTDTDTFSVTVVNNAPVLAVPTDRTVTATGTTGAAVTFTATATDVEDGTAAVVCAPASGSTFAIGATIVNCTATDSDNATDSDSFVLTIVNTPPSITVPPGVTAAATSASGAVVNFNVTATDAQQGTVTVSCSPPTGSTFPVGVTTVTCTATDANGSTTTANFTVTVTNAQLPPTGGNSRTTLTLAAAIVAVGLLLRSLCRLRFDA